MANRCAARSRRRDTEAASHIRCQPQPTVENRAAGDHPFNTSPNRTEQRQMAKENDAWNLDGEDVLAVEALVDPREQDTYWEVAHAREQYFRTELTYEDYAPAYCVGYIGYAQYRGSFADAEKSLLANWCRIKGDSRLTLDEACLAIRAAWDRVAARG
jgi:hypothetical protein